MLSFFVFCACSWVVAHKHSRFLSCHCVILSFYHNSTPFSKLLGLKGIRRLDACAGSWQGLSRFEVGSVFRAMVFQCSASRRGWTCIEQFVRLDFWSLAVHITTGRRRLKDLPGALRVDPKTASRRPTRTPRRPQYGPKRGQRRPLSPYPFRLSDPPHMVLHLVGGGGLCLAMLCYARLGCAMFFFATCAMLFCSTPL